MKKISILILVTALCGSTWAQTHWTGDIGPAIEKMHTSNADVIANAEIPGLNRILHVPTEFSSIQAAIDAAANGDTVLVAEGTYYENIFFKGKAIMLTSEFILDGDTSHISKTIIDGSQPADPDIGTVVSFDDCKDSTSVLNGFSITGGTGRPLIMGVGKSGGGVRIINAGAKVINNYIFKNRVEVTAGSVSGAGVLAASVDNAYNIVIRNNKVFENDCSSAGSAEGGGIMAVCKNGNIIIENNQISKNTCHSTAVYKVVGAGVEIVKIYGHPGTAILRNNYIHHNSLYCKASMGGGLYVLYAREPIGENLSANVPVQIYNNVFCHNYSRDKGGGVGIWNMCVASGLTETVPDPLFFNNTLIQNMATWGGVGIFNYGAEIVMMNNILWNYNSDTTEIFNEDISYPKFWGINQNDGIIHSYNNIVKGGYTGTGIYTGNGNMNNDPNLVNDFCLQDGSICIGKGTTKVKINNKEYHAPSLDYFGQPRTSETDLLVDIGAVEWQQGMGISPHRFNPGELALFPNPASNTVTLRFSLTRPSPVRISIINLLGQETMIILDESRMPGEQEVSFDASALKSGIYIVRMVSDKISGTRLVVK